VGLADGRSLSFIEIIAEQAQGKEHFCYTIRKMERLVWRGCQSRMTRRKADVVRVRLDNDDTSTAPDHPFLMRMARLDQQPP